MGYVPPDPPQLIEVTTIGDAERVFIELGRAARKSGVSFGEFQALRAPDDTRKILRDAMVGMVLLTALAVTAVVGILQLAGVL